MYNKNVVYLYTGVLFRFSDNEIMKFEGIWMELIKITLSMNDVT